MATAAIEAPKRTRDPEKTRAEILAVAFKEIHARGFQSVSVNDIVVEAKLTKGAFFHYFPTKNDLGYAIADETLVRLVRDRWLQPLAAYKNPVHGILMRLKKVIETMPDATILKGCPLNNLTQEMSPIDPVFSEKLIAVVEFWIHGIEKYLIKAKEEGYLKAKANPRRVAEFVVMVHEGAYAMAKTMQNRKIFWSMYESLKDYLDAVSN